jgi:nicotinate-nucleotide adenylyltransferase
MRVQPFLSSGQTIALFGGSFDPPHAGHRLVAEAALSTLALDYIWWMVSPQNPLKNNAASELEPRLAATRALAEHPQFHVDAVEAELGTQYAIDTVRALKTQYPDVRFIWLLGADNLRQLHQWKDWQSLMAEIPVAVYPRGTDLQAALEAPAALAFLDAQLPSAEASQLKDKPAPAWVLLQGELSPLSSTELRRQQTNP